MEGYKEPCLKDLDSPLKAHKLEDCLKKSVYFNSAGNFTKEVLFPIDQDYQEEELTIIPPFKMEHGILF